MRRDADGIGQCHEDEHILIKRAATGISFQELKVLGPRFRGCQGASISDMTSMRRCNRIFDGMDGGAGADDGRTFQRNRINQRASRESLARARSSEERQTETLR